MLNAERRLSEQTSSAKSAATSSGYQVDAPESTAISTAMSTAAATGVVSTADSTVKAYALSVSNVALSAASSAVAANAIAVSAASSAVAANAIAVSAASSGVVADSKAESATLLAVSAASSGVVADSKAESATLIAVSAQSSAASAQVTADSAASSAVVADSKAVSVGTTMQARNLGNKNVGSVQNSDADLRISTAGDYAIGNVIYTKAASSAVFALPASTLSSSQAIKLLATLNSAGTGVVTAGALADSAATVLPATPAGGCPVAIIDIACGTSSIVLGTTTFSEITSSGGSTVITQIVGVN